MKKFIIYIIATGFLALGSCQKYLDIVPDNIPTIENSFTMRTMAERFLFSCYSYMPKHSSITENPAFTAGDEIWLHQNYITPGWEIARGGQNVVSPYLNFWQGERSGRDLYQAIRDCNIFLENIGKVPDMENVEKDRWIAEVKFLKAYYHFFLIRMYGPIPLKKENLPVDASVQEVKVARNTADECFDYVVQLLDEAYVNLPPKIVNESSELGRITQPIALAIKAKVLMTAASPLFNGNPDYAGYKNNDGTLLFNPVFQPEKWVKAKEACKLAIEACELAGNRLYYYSQSGQQYNVSPQIRTQMNIRNSVTEKWNYEVVWGNTNSMTDGLQVEATPRGLDPLYRANNKTRSNAGVPLKIAAMFYSKNGVPIDEDKNWTYADRFTLKQGTAAEKLYIRQGYTTASFNFNREPRFYADLGFDGGVWYGQGKFDDNSDLLYVSAKRGDPTANVTNDTYNVSGYWPKKLVNYLNVIDASSYTRVQYPWPVIRLADLYLLYAEAINEVDGPEESYYWVDEVRKRAGLDGVINSWENNAFNKDKPKSKDGMREIIHRERLIELAFEGQRFWDLRRWKEALNELNKPITGWDIAQKTPEGYYREKVLFQQSFLIRNYLWPISEKELLANKNTVQNPGW